MKLDYAAVRASDEIRTYITQADASLIAMGYTEHSFAHVAKCAETAAGLLSQLGYDERQVELTKIASYMHDIGIGYGSINHPVDRDPLCGYNGIIDDTCPCCHRGETTRVTERIKRIKVD